MRKIIFTAICALPFALQAQLYVGSGETVTVVEGTDVFFAGVEVEATGLLDVQATSVNTNCVIDGEITGDDRISFGDLTNLSIDNGTWTVEWDTPNENNEILNNFSINTNGFAIVPSGNSLTISGAFANYNAGTGITLEADANGYAQLLTLGATLKGTMLAQQYMTADNNFSWRQLASPVSTTLAEIDDDFQTYYPAAPGVVGVASQWNVYWYDASPINPGGGNTTSSLPNGSDANAKHWTAAANNGEVFGPADNARAYNVFMGTPFSIGLGDPGILDVSGEFGNGDYSFDCYRTDDFIAGESGETNPTLITGWNLIPNPYPSNIDVSTLLLDNSNFDLAYKAVHVWNAKLGQYEAITATVSSVIEWNNVQADANDETHNIAPFQAFWVKADATPSTSASADENIVLTNAHRTVEDNMNVFKTTPPVIRLRVANQNESMSDQTVLAFESMAELGMDQFDAFKLMSQNEDAPSLYTNIEGKKISINQLPATEEYYRIPLFMESVQSGTEFNVEMRTHDIDPTWTIHLEDTKNGKMHNLRNGGYTFNHDGTMSKNRFVVHINKKPSNIIDPTSWNNVSIYGNADGINVAFANPANAQADIVISNVAGQILYQGTVSTGRVFTFPVDASTAVYAIKVVSGEKVSHEKIVR